MFHRLSSISLGFAFLAIGLGCSSTPKAPMPVGFDPAPAAFDTSAAEAESVVVDHGRLLAQKTSSNPELKPIVRQGARVGSEVDENAVVEASPAPSSDAEADATKPKTENRAPASLSGVECESGYDCPAGQFCRAKSDGKKVCVGGTPNVAYCQTSSDCGNGRCKDRGDGVKICMGGGSGGDACSSNSDCAGGLCRDRGDGVKMCMGNGKRNDVCVTSSDCGSGSCKDRGDGLKICM